MTIEEYVNKRVNEEDDLRGLAKELLTNYYEGWTAEELQDLGIQENDNDWAYKQDRQTAWNLSQREGQEHLTRIWVATRGDR